MRAHARKPIRLGTSISIAGRDAVLGRCVREGYRLCQKHGIVLVEQSAQLVFDVRDVDLHQHLGVC